MANGRCRMHGGKSSGRPITHGYYTQAVVSERKGLRNLIGQINQLVKELEVVAPRFDSTLTMPYGIAIAIASVWTVFDWPLRKWGMLPWG